jgi:phosphoglycerol transferase MdoB-like AlkP superfamily enzyme
MTKYPKRLKLLHAYIAPLLALLLNLLLAYVVYFIARIAYLLDNWSYFSESLSWEIWQGGLVFDTSAILVTNIPYIVLMLFPLHWKECKVWHLVCKWEFVIINTLALVLNLCDAAYFPYTMRRTTATVFDEFQNEGNIGGVFFIEALRHWYFVVLTVIVAYGLWKLYITPKLEANKLSWWRYDLVTLASLAAVAPFVVAGIRGGFATAVRPITISNANQYVNRPTDAALVLNTPFSIYRTIGLNVFVVPDYYKDGDEMAQVYSPVHVPNDTIPMTKKNVVVLIVESFGREYIGALNKTLENGRYRGYTPCVDSLIAKSITFTHSYCNGRKSIDGMPSILSSIPMFVEPFFLTPASMNHVDGIASLLAGEGYQTAFFHGAQRGSMGFQAFARSTGFQEYYGREDYDADERFGGDDDFDGMWAIWDEPFLQYYATKMSEMKEPFMTAVFTASSHHPFAIPEKYQKRFPEENLEIHKCIRYTDMAIGKFFETASREPWFKNTIFVLTSDHTNMSDHPEYQTDLGGFCSPIIVYEPGREAEVLDKIAQQIDILPTVMGMLHYQKTYFGFGIDLLNTPAEDTWAVNYMGGIYQYVKHGHVLQFDGQNTRSIYALSDSLMQHNLMEDGRWKTEDGKTILPQMERELKAIIQQYMERMTQDRLQP